MHRVPKGQFGYIRYERKKTITATALIFAAALGIYFGAMLWLGTNQNYFTIAAVLIMLPGARSAVSMIMFLRALPCSEDAHASIETHIGSLDGAYDLYLTSEKQNFALSHLAVGAKSVIALTEDAKCDAAAGEQHIRKMLQSNGFHGCTVKIFDSLQKYDSRLDQLSRLEGEAAGGHEALLQLMYNISL